MKYNVYGIFDNQIKRFSVHLAIRTETPDQVADISRLGYLKMDPKQRDPLLSCFHLGTFDDVNAKFDLLGTPVLVCANAVFEEEIKNVQQAESTEA